MPIYDPITKNTLYTGVVEDINDPLKAGRIKVRVTGVHTLDKVKLPTAKLPWTKATNTPGAIFSTVPKEGDIVYVWFEDDGYFQFPVFHSIVVHIRTKNPDLSGSTIKPEKRPKSNQKQPGELNRPTKIPPVAYGDLEKSLIASANLNLAHACDFKFQMNFGIDFASLINPVSEFSRAIKRGKNRATQLIRGFISFLTDSLQKLMQGVVLSVSLDPSGVLSSWFSKIKKSIEEANALIKQIAQFIEDAAFIVYLVKEIQQLLEFLKSLPEKVLAIIQNCILNFTQGLDNALNQLKGIPGMAQNTFEGIFSDLQQQTQQMIADAQTELQDGTISIVSGNTVINISSNLAFSMFSGNANTIIINNLIDNSFANANTIMAQNEANTFTTGDFAAP